MREQLLHLVTHVLVDVNVRYTKMSTTWECLSTWMASVIYTIHWFCPGASWWLDGKCQPSCLPCSSQTASSCLAGGSGIQGQVSSKHRPRGERGELWGPPCSHCTLGMGHMGCAGLQLDINSGDLHTPPMNTTLNISPSIICLRLLFFSFKVLFLLTYKKA